MVRAATSVVWASSSTIHAVPTTLTLVAVATWDAAARRRLHPVYLWGGALFIVSIPLRVVVAQTSAWQSFALWLVG